MLNHYSCILRGRFRILDGSADASIITSMDLFYYGVVRCASWWSSRRLLDISYWRTSVTSMGWSYLSILENRWADGRIFITWIDFTFWRTWILQIMRTTMYYLWAAAICEVGRFEDLLLSHSLSLSLSLFSSCVLWLPSPHANRGDSIALVLTCQTQKNKIRKQILSQQMLVNNFAWRNDHIPIFQIWNDPRYW